MRNTTNSIDLSSEQLHLVRELLREHIPHAEVWAYGSRVRWISTPKSNLDMVAQVSEEEKEKIYALREAFDESSLPFHVEFFVWDDVPEDFHAQIKKEFFVLQGQLKDSKLKNNFIPLGDCLSYTAKGITPKYLDANGEHAILVLNQKCNRNFNIDFNLARFHNTQQKKVPVEKMLYTGDVLINSTGTGTAGRVAQILSLPEATTVDSHMIILRSNEHFDTSYFGYAIKYNQREIEYLAEGSTGQTEINRKRLSAEIKIFFPPLKTQKQIAHVLSTIDKKIELNQRINENLEQQAQAVFKSWFVDFVPFGGVMPSDWRYDSLENFVSIKRGGSPRPIHDYLVDKGLKWLKISDATSERTPFISSIKESIREEGLKKTVFLKANALVLSNSATPGIPKILDLESCIHDGWLYFPQSQFSNYYLYLLFQNIKRDLLSLGNGSVFTNLKTDILKRFKVIKPKTKVLKQFDNIVNPLFNKIRDCSRENNNLITLRDTLLPKLMSGEIDVSQVKI